MFNIFRRFCCCKNYQRMCECNIQRTECWRCKCTREVLDINEITYDELIKKVNEGAILLDVRTRQEFIESHLDGSILIPYYEISKKIENIIPNKKQTIIVYCQNGGRSIKAYKILNRLGYSNIYNLKGGKEAININPQSAKI